MELVILPDGRQVDCSCQKPLSAPVLFDYLSATHSVTSCLCCGQLTVSELVQVSAQPLRYAVVPLEPQVLFWLAAFPRLANRETAWHKSVLLPATARAKNQFALNALFEQQSQLQQDKSLDQRLKLVGMPTRRAPAEPPAFLRAYIQVMDGLELSVGSHFLDLLIFSGPGNRAAPLAQHLLRQRDDLVEQIVQALRTVGPRCEIQVLSLVAQLKLSAPPILSILEQRLWSVAADNHGAISGLLFVVDQLGGPARALTAALQALAKRVASDNAFLHRRVVGTLERMAES